MAFGIDGLKSTLKNITDLITTLLNAENYQGIFDAASSAGTVADQVIEANIIEELTALLRNVNCFAELFAFGETLTAFAKSCAYAGALGLLLWPIINIASEYFSSQREKSFTDFVKLRLDTLVASSLQENRISAGLFLQQYHRDKAEGVPYEIDNERLAKLVREVRYIIDFSPGMDVLQLRTYAESLLANLYTAVGVDPLDSTSLTVNPVTVKLVLKSKLKPSGSTSPELTFARVKYLFGEVETERALELITQALHENGGALLYSETNYIHTSRKGHFAKGICDVLQAVEAHQAGTRQYYTKPVKQMLEELYRLRSSVPEMLSPEHPEYVNNDIICVLFNRGLLKLCEEMSPYFYGIYYAGQKFSLCMSYTSLLAQPCTFFSCVEEKPTPLYLVNYDTGNGQDNVEVSSSASPLQTDWVPVDWELS